MAGYPRRPTPSRRDPAGFTLIEMLAVVAIFALMVAFVAPNLGVMSRRTLRHEADQLAAQLELARQRSVVTSVPHRLYLDLDGGAFRLEWLGPEEGEEPLEEPEPLDLRGATPLPLEAPRQPGREYLPLPGVFGHLTPLDPDIAFAGVETPEGWIQRGDAYVSFERDGTASYTVIVLESEDGDTLELEVQPLADAVRVRDAAG